MESLLKWYSENGTALWATIISFLSVNAFAIIGLVLGFVKTKLASIKASEAFCNKLDEVYEAFAELVNSNKEDIIAACDANTKKRIEKMNELAESVNAKNDELKEASSTTDANDALGNLD